MYLYRYIRRMYFLQKTKIFSEWFERIRDRKTQARIVMCLAKMEMGLFGDCKSIGDGVSEIRLDYGPGYRIYFTKKNKVIIILLIGGDKSTQERDIVKAKMILKNSEVQDD
jgi:putative addiction module killer protein